MNTIGILLFDGVEELDAVGPWEVFGIAAKEQPEIRPITIAPTTDVVTCAKGLRLLLVMKLQHNKTDAGDAELLAEIARTGFCRAVSVASEAAPKARILLKARAHLVRQRRDTENAIRGVLGSLGLRFPKGAGKLAGRVHAALEARPDLKVAIEPLLSTVATLKREIERRRSWRASRRRQRAGF